MTTWHYRPPSPDTIMKAAIRRATGYAREGALNKALNTLQSTGLAEANEETLWQLLPLPSRPPHGGCSQTTYGSWRKWTTFRAGRVRLERKASWTEAKK